MQLATLVRVPVPEEVDQYLGRYPGIASLVPEVCDAATSRFGPETQLSLEVYHDAESNDEYLALYARQNPYDARILDTLEEVARPFDAALQRTTGWLLVTTDFRLPR